MNQSGVLSAEVQAFIDRCAQKGLRVTLSEDGKYFILRNELNQVVGRSCVRFLSDGAKDPS